MDLFTSDSIRKLETLLKPPGKEDDSSDDDEIATNQKTKLGPGDIGEHFPVKIKRNEVIAEVKKTSERIPFDPDEIWDPNEVQALPFTDDDLLDPRDRPEFSMKYKQELRSEDVYLQTGNRTCASASCEVMVVSIELPGEDKSVIDCTVQDSSLDIRSPRYRLHLDLPHPVHEDQTKAIWDADKFQLSVELTLNREWDAINF